MRSCIDSSLYLYDQTQIDRPHSVLFGTSFKRNKKGAQLTTFIAYLGQRFCWAMQPDKTANHPFAYVLSEFWRLLHSLFNFRSGLLCSFVDATETFCLKCWCLVCFFWVSCPEIRSYMCFLLHERPHVDIFQWRPWNPWTPLQQCSARVKGPLFCPPPPVSSTSNLLPPAMSLSQCIGRDRMVINAGAQDFFHQVPSQIWKIDVLHIFPKYFTLCYQEWIA